MALESKLLANASEYLYAYGLKGLHSEEIADKISARQEGDIKFPIPFFQTHEERGIKYPKDGFTLKDGTSPSGLHERWEGGSHFSAELHFKERIYFEEPHKFGIPSFLLLQVICSRNKEQ